MKTYMVIYRHKGEEYVTHLEADDHYDALRRLNAIRQTGSVEGELMATIPVPGGDALTRAWEWIKGVWK